MDRNELLRLQGRVRVTKARIGSTRKQVARTSELLMRHRREQLGRAIETLSPQDRQYAAIRAWIDRNTPSPASVDFSNS